MHRGSRRHAAKLLRAILTNDEHPLTAHDALDTHDALPLHVRRAGERKAVTVGNLRG